MKIEKLVALLGEMPPLINDRSTRRKYRIIAAALDKKGRVLAVRTNDYQCSHPLQKYFAQQVGSPESIFLHAEIATLIAARKEVHTLLVARINAAGEPVPANPCPICSKAIEAFGVKEVIHT